MALCNDQFFFGV